MHSYLFFRFNRGIICNLIAMRYTKYMNVKAGTAIFHDLYSKLWNQSLEEY